MFDFRVYRLDRNGRILAGEYVTAQDADDAIAAIRQRAEQTDCEVWLGAKRLAMIPAGGGEAILAAQRQAAS